MPVLKSQIANRKSQISVAAVLVFAALIRFFPLGLTHPRAFHLDEWDFTSSAVQMWAEGTLDPGRYVHPALYRYSVAAAYPVVSHVLRGVVGAELRPWFPYVAGRLVSAGMGVLGVWLVFRLAARLMAWGGALAAALILAVAPLHVQFSHIAKPDVMMATWVALATLLAWRLAEAPRRRLYVLAGLAVGLAVASKYNGVVAAAPIFAAHMAARGLGRWPRRLLAPNLWLAGACSVAAFAVTSPYTLIAWARGANSLMEGYHHLVALPSDPDRVSQGPALVEFGRQALDWVGVVPLALAVAGAVIWWREKRAALWVVGSVVAATAALISFWAVQQPFYLLPLVPAVATMAAVPIARLRARRWAAAALLAACLAPSLALSAREVVRFRLPGTRQMAKAWLVGHQAGREGNILRDHDSLEAAADEVLPVIDAGFGFYAKVDRAYLGRQSVTHFVLSDSAAQAYRLTPAAAQRKAEARARLLELGELLVRIPPNGWREGPGIEIYQVKDTLLREFESEREREAEGLRAKVKAVEEQLASRPRDAVLRLEAGRLLCHLAATSRADDAMGIWKAAEDHFRQASLADPTLADAPYDLGCLYLRVAAWATRTGGPEASAAWFARAADAFRAAIALDPRHADAHFNLGFALWSAVTRDDAVRRAVTDEGTRAYRRAAELNPDLRVPDLHILAVAERGPQPLH